MRAKRPGRLAKRNIKAGSVSETRRAAILRAPLQRQASLPPRPWRLERKPDGHVIIRDANGDLISFFSSTVINHVVAVVNGAARREETDQ